MRLTIDRPVPSDASTYYGRPRNATTQAEQCIDHDPLVRQLPCTKGSDSHSVVWAGKMRACVSWAGRGGTMRSVLVWQVVS